MSASQFLFDLQHNPFIYAPYIATFYHNLSGSEQTILLAPLIIPTCIHPNLQEKIEHSTSRSSIFTIFKEPKLYFDLVDRIKCFQQITLESIELCVTNNWLTVDTINLNFATPRPKYVTWNEILVARKLALLLSGFKPVEIFNVLGVPPHEVYDF